MGAKGIAKLKNTSLRFKVAHRVFEIAEKEKNKDNWQVFHNGWMLLYFLGCKKELLDFIENYSNEMEPDEFDEHDWVDFNNMRDA